MGPTIEVIPQHKNPVTIQQKLENHIFNTTKKRKKERLEYCNYIASFPPGFFLAPNILQFHLHSEQWAVIDQCEPSHSQTDRRFLH